MHWVGWKSSVSYFIVGSVIVFGLNLGVLAWAAKRAAIVSDDGSVVLQDSLTNEACAKQKQLDIWAHLLINVFSTIILGGSNYCMQCLSAPTRSDIDKSHACGQYLDIGVSSFRNLFQVSWTRVSLWVALGLTSLPLHLFYNSAIYESTTSNNYAVFSVAPDFVQTGSPSNISAYQDAIGALQMPSDYRPLGSPVNTTIATLLTRLQTAAQADQLTKLSSADCINGYVQTFQSKYRSVILVTENGTDAIKYVEARFWRNFECYNRQPYLWACGYAQQLKGSQDCPIECDQTSLKSRIMDDASAGEWSPMGDKVQYCLAEPSEKQCRLQFNMPIAITVVSLNFAKIILMTLVFRIAFRKKQHPILTSGDAATSFLTEPDVTTRFRCLVSKEKVLDAEEPGWVNEELKARHNGSIWLPAPTKYVATRLRWGKAVSIRRWFLSLLLYAIALGVAAGYLGKGISALTGSKDVATLWRMGIGSVSGGAGSGKAIVFSDDQVNLRGAALLLRMVLYANIPQLILSMLYITYNAMFTIMLMAHEWSSFGVERKGLRVCATTPVGEQRDSYWLQLPFRWSIPLMVFSIILHWLVSQSIFLVNVNFTGYDGELLPPPQDGTEVNHLLTLGYSPIAIILVIVVAVILIAFVIMLAVLRKMPSTMPLAANNSSAISAACHTIYKTSDIASKRLRWGETGAWPEEDLGQTRMLLQDTGSGYALSDMSNNAGSYDPSQPNSTVNLIAAEYLRPGMGVSYHEHEVPLLEPGEEYWHCGFSSTPVETPVSGRKYL